MSLSGNPASRNRCAMASEAAVTLPTESVVLISISCLKMSYESFLVASSICARDVGTRNKRAKKIDVRKTNHLPQFNGTSITFRIALAHERHGSDKHNEDQRMRGTR